MRGKKELYYVAKCAGCGAVMGAERANTPIEQVSHAATVKAWDKKGYLITLDKHLQMPKIEDDRCDEKNEAEQDNYRAALNSNKSKFGERVFDYRKMWGVSQSEFWEALGILQSVGSRYERGFEVPPWIGKLVELILDKQSKVTLDSVRKLHGEATRIDNAWAVADRKHIGMSQTDYWKMFEVGQSAGSRWERGDGGLKIPFTVRLVMAVVRRGGTH